MEQCPSGHDRTRKSDGSLGLYCTDCSYKFPSNEVLDSASPARTEPEGGTSVEVERIIREGVEGIAINSFPVPEDTAQPNGRVENGVVGDDGPASNTSTEPFSAEAANFLRTSGDGDVPNQPVVDSGIDSSFLAGSMQANNTDAPGAANLLQRSESESGHPGSETENDNPSLPDDKNQTVETYPPENFQNSTHSSISSKNSFTIENEAEVGTINLVNVQTVVLRSKEKIGSITVKNDK